MNDSEEFKVRRMEFDIKADASPDPTFFTIESREGWARITRVDYKQQEKPKSAAAYLRQ